MANSEKVLIVIVLAYCLYALIRVEFYKKRVTVIKNKRKKMKTGITFSSFDLLHSGHIKMLEDAKQKCDYLICGLQTDPTLDRPEKNKPIQSIVERYTQLNGCKYVDEIVPYTTEQDLQDILQSFKIDIRIIGDEYKNKQFTGKEYCKKKGIAFHFNKREHRFSSSGLRKEIQNKENILQVNRKIKLVV